MHKVVVFCSYVYTSLGLIRCLGERGYYPECICYGESAESAKYLFASKYIRNKKFFHSVEDATRYLVDEYPISEEKPILLTIPDPPAYYVDINKTSLETKFILMSAGEAGSIVHLMGKHTISALAKKHGLPVPNMIELDRLDQIPDGLTYPVFTKSITSTDGGKSDECICHSKQELESNRKRFKSDKVLVMQYIHKINEVNYFGIAVNGHVYMDYCDIRPRAKEGSYGHYNIFKLCPKDDLYDKIVSLIKDTNYNGLFDVEFLEDSAKILYFMEVNFRVDGEVYKLSPGVNLPAEWCRLILLKDNELPEKLIMGKPYFTGMSESYDFKESVLSGNVGFFTWFLQFCKADKYVLINFKDPKPALVKIYVIIKRIIYSVFH